MLKIKELINNIGDFEFDVDNDKLCFAGVLLDKEKVVLRGRIAAEFVRLIENYDAYCVRGKVNGIAVTLIDSIIINIEERIGEQYAYFTFRPAEVVLGRSYNAEAKVTKMWMTTQTLNWMFSESPLKTTSNFTRENPSILEYTYPDELCAEDKFGKLRIYQSFGRTFDRHGVHHEMHTVVEYLFNEPVAIKEALGKLAAARNLFTFFANHYLPLENIEFMDELCGENAGTINETCTLYLNGKENVVYLDEPFLIMTKEVKEDFKEIWVRWLRLYEEADYIASLFYEIICNRSVGTNRFLNYSQALEVYSYKLRDKEARKMAKDDGGKRKEIPLKYRLEDILLFVNQCLNVDTKRVSGLAKAIADMRNFYTHYNDGRYRKPTYDEMLAAGHVLEFVLLAVVYQELGISGEHIAKCKERSAFQRLDEFIDIINKS